MFDFDVKKVGDNTVATLKANAGITYTVRFFCGKYRAFDFFTLSKEETKKLKAELAKLRNRH